MMKQLAFALFGFTAIAPLAAIPASAQTAATEQTVTFAVENMTCALCPVTVKRAMENVEGVREVEVNLDAKTATVLFDSAVTDAQTIGAASANAGYPAEAAG